MNLELKDLIQMARDSLRKVGQTADYVESLTHTWNAFLSYHSQNPRELTREYASRFLSERYGIPPNVKVSSLRPIHRRRKRAIEVLLNCKENRSPFVSHTYWECRFIEPFMNAFSAFLDARKSRNFALPTINRDIYGLNRFSEYLSMLKADSFGDINGELVAGFIKWLSQETGLPTVKGATSTLRLLFKFLNDEGYTTRDLSTTVPKVRVHKDVPSTYTPCEIESMLKGMCGGSKVVIRNYAMVLLAVRLGMRASDICGLRLRDIDWHKSEIAFTSKKTGKYTVLPLMADIGNAIIGYLKDARPADADSHLFLRYQKPYRGLEPSVMHKMVTTAMREAGVIIPCGKRHGPHALRASLASSMLRNNVPLPVISETLSHSSTDTTRIYLKVDTENLRRLALNVPPLKGIWLGGVPA